LPLVIEGVRHKEALRHITDVVHPAKVVLVYLDVDEGERIKRMEGRAGESGCGAKAVETHSTEHEVDDLRLLADLVVSADEQVGVTVRTIVGFLEL